jgi:hypothetical protein
MMNPASPSHCPECDKPVPAAKRQRIFPACLMALTNKRLNSPQHNMNKPLFTLPRSIVVLSVSSLLGCGSIAPAQQAAPATPFTSGVQISVVASKPARGYGGYSDYKTQKIVLTVKFANTDTRTTYEGYTATISALAQSASDTKLKKVLMQDEVTLSLAPRKTQEQVCPEVTTSFDKVGYKYGFAYYAWVIVVKDPQGKIVQVESSAAPLEKLTVLASKLEKGKYYDSKLKPVANPGYSSD